MEVVGERMFGLLPQPCPLLLGQLNRLAYDFFLRLFSSKLAVQVGLYRTVSYRFSFF